MKNKIIICTFASFILLYANTIIAQDTTRPLSLQQAIDLSTKNSKNLKISNARVEEASANLQEASDRQLPDFKVSGSYLRLNSAKVDLKSRSDTSTNNSGPKINQAVYGIANLSFPLFAGGRIKYGIESAKLLKQAVLSDSQSDKAAVVFNTIKAYINLFKSYETVTLIKENLQASLSRNTTLINLEKNGLLARNDLLKSQLQTSNIALEMLDAENSNKLAMVNMNLMLGLPENTVLILDTSFLNIKQEIKNLPDLEMLALRDRADLQALGYRKKSAGIAIRAAKAEAYPSIALTGGYIAAYIPNFITVTNAINIGLGIQYNLASFYKKNTSLMQAKARQAQVNANEEILNDAIRLEVNQDYQNYLLSIKKIDVYQKTFEQATENYRITNNKYNNSLVTITDLLDADVALLQTRLNISFAKADAVLAYNKLLQTSGLLSK